MILRSPASVTELKSEPEPSLGLLLGREQCLLASKQGKGKKRPDSGRVDSSGISPSSLHPKSSLKAPFDSKFEQFDKVGGGVFRGSGSGPEAREGCEKEREPWLAS